MIRVGSPTSGTPRVGRAARSTNPVDALPGRRDARSTSLVDARGALRVEVR